MHRERSPELEAAKARPKGRPRGAVTLTKERMEMILALIRAGSFAYVAAEAAGVSERTFHEWIARGEERHPTRGSTPKLRAFAEQVRIAHAEARIAAELTIHKTQPGLWLSRVARTKPDREGWTDPPKQDQMETSHGMAGLSRMSDEELDDDLMRLQEAVASTGTFWAPPCPHPRCRCPWHRRWKERKQAQAARHPRRRSR
jgi:hypothetical protein